LARPEERRVDPHLRKLDGAGAPLGQIVHGVSEGSQDRRRTIVGRPMIRKAPVCGARVGQELPLAPKLTGERRGQGNPRSAGQHEGTGLHFAIGLGIVGDMGVIRGRHRRPARSSLPNRFHTSRSNARWAGGCRNRRGPAHVRPARAASRPCRAETRRIRCRESRPPLDRSPSWRSPADLRTWWRSQDFGMIRDRPAGLEADDGKRWPFGLQDSARIRTRISGSKRRQIDRPRTHSRAIPV
jgi:hypothetical protein